jgi:hypothetical protein
LGRPHAANAWACGVVSTRGKKEKKKKKNPHKKSTLSLDPAPGPRYPAVRAACCVLLKTLTSPPYTRRIRACHQGGASRGHGSLTIRPRLLTGQRRTSRAQGPDQGIAYFVRQVNVTGPSRKGREEVREYQVRGEARWRCDDGGEFSIRQQTAGSGWTRTRIRDGRWES